MAESISKYQKSKIQKNIVLFRAKTIWPFNFFPDEISIDLRTINIVYKPFFLVKYPLTLRIEDIRLVRVVSGVIFGSIYLEIEGFETNPSPVNYLKNTDALRIETIINGLIIANKDKINLLGLEKQQILKRVEELGSNPVLQS